MIWDDFEESFWTQIPKLHTHVLFCSFNSGVCKLMLADPKEMSKHAGDDAQGDFWKKMKYGAAAAVAVGSGICAMASVLKNKGFSNYC